jgi:hypothetical protein
VYEPSAAEVTVDLGAEAAEFAVTWFGPETNETRPAAAVRASGPTAFAVPCGPGGAVLHLKRTAP